MRLKMPFPSFVRKIDMKHKTIPVFVPHMGCPNDCSFCNQRKITGRENDITPEYAEKQIDEALKTINADSECVEIGFFGGSFTGIDKQLQSKFLSVAKKYKDIGLVHEIRLSTRPDYINSDVLDLLCEFGVTTVELGAQSMDDTVLNLNHRGHTAEQTINACNLIKEKKIKLGLQMMTGLYGDSDKTCIKSCEKIIAQNPDCVRIYPTLVLKGTYLEELYKAGRYTPQTLEDAVRLCAILKTKFDEANIPVIRLGLMASDNINPDSDVVAGPYHPSIGELVQSGIYFEKIINELKTDAEIFVNDREISAFVGNRKNNIKRLKDAGYNVIFKTDKNIAHGEYKIIRKEQR